MKLLVFSLSIFAAMFLSSCCNRTEKPHYLEDSLTEVPLPDSIEETTLALRTIQDTLTDQLKQKDVQAMQATFARVQAQYQTFLSNGDVEAAQNYGNQVKEFIDAHAAELAALVQGNNALSALIEQIKSYPINLNTFEIKDERESKTRAKETNKRAEEAPHKAGNRNTDDATPQSAQHPENTMPENE